ncbi:nucleotidyltransferase domain-containing protein [Rhodophyticola sp. CCM32]|uniref:nucleotidyltransferase domain-containing protein n=1 Tax=Rhodophyticola sp. CCM32 TaxID=2916397 RepID=UPI00107FB577|nr:nucleotidyltransferase domain-containing protein [Rhodophyticola sp. CCM32]QBY01597.1 nucleotidyltransferase domain-containing protein [Rhodophyticola sp. CCM32]
MSQKLSAALSAAEKIRDQFFPEASTCMLAGSVVRGDATAYSDLDLVVVFERVENAQRQSFTFGGWPVEAFIHDPQTLEYFFREVDRPSGVPSLPNMVSEGIEIPRETKCGSLMKDLASRILEEGPVQWGQQERENSRYTISDMVEDIREPRNIAELRIVVSNLYSAIADHFLRSQNQWSAKGKSIPRRLMSVDPEFHKRFAEAFEAAFTSDDTTAVIRLCEHVLEPDGGFLFQGYTRHAPKEWRMPDA